MIRHEGTGIQYQGLSEPVMPPTAQSVGAGWMGSCLPPTRRKFATALLVAACVLPTTSAQGTANPPTGWRPTLTDRVVRKVVLVPQRPSFFGPELINSNPGDPGGAIIATGSIPILQYQSLAAPFNDTPAPEFTTQIVTVGVDVTRGRLGVHASRQQFYAADRFDAPAAASVTALSWAATYPDRLTRLRQTALSASDLAPTFATFIDLNWHPVYPDQHLVVRTFARYIWPQPEFIVEVDVPVMSWTGAYLDNAVTLKARRQIQQLSGSLEPTLLSEPTLPPASSWTSKYPDTVRGPRRALATFSGPANPPLFVPDQTNPVTVLSWQGRYADRVPPARRVIAPPAFNFDAQYTAPTPVIVPKDTTPVYVHRVYGKPRKTWAPDLTAPNFVPDVTQPVRPLSWDAQYPDLIWPATSLLTAAQLALMIDARIAPPIVVATPATGHNRVGIPRRQRTVAIRGLQRVIWISRSTRDV